MWRDILFLTMLVMVYMQLTYIHKILWSIDRRLRRRRPGDGLVLDENGLIVDEVE